MLKGAHLQAADKNDIALLSFRTKRMREKIGEHSKRFQTAREKH